MKFYILRHGESVDDIEDCYGGMSDFPLTDKGREQARSVAEQLNNEDIQAICSSPLSRAHETATLIAQQLRSGIEVTVVGDLQERNSYGVLSGVNKARAAQIFPQVLRNLKEKPGYSREPLVGAEDFDEFIRRVERAFTQLVKFAQERELERVAVVSHGTFTRTLFADVLGVGDIALDLGTIKVIDYKPAEANVTTLNAGTRQAT